MKNQIITTNQLTKSYKNVEALKPTTMTVEAGSIYGLVGRNGAGKTTLLKLLTGQANPTSGEISLLGQSGIELLKARTRIGALIEQTAFFPELSGRKNLEYYRIQRGIVEKESVEQAIKLVKLDEYADRKVKEYSLGNKQRLGLALALLQKPDLLILDEPINGLDPMGIVEIRELLVELNKLNNMTIIISSHILAELELMITKVGFIEAGEIIEEKSIQELREVCQNFIHLEVNNSPKAVVILEKELALTHYEVISHNEVHLFEAQQQISQISRVLNQQDVDVRIIQNKELTLEEYYIKLIGGGQHA